MTGGMNFELTEDQELIRKSVAELAAKFGDQYWMHKDQATVGALRKAAEGHDVSIQALSKHDKSGPSFQEFAANTKAMSGVKD